MVFDILMFSIEVIDEEHGTVALAGIVVRAVYG
jgi:hypothetical protein